MYSVNLIIFFIISWSSSECKFLVSDLQKTINRHPSWEFLTREHCGVGSLSDRIIGGQEAGLGQFPWMVNLGYWSNVTSWGYHFGCGGAILNRWYVITAAHCIVGHLKSRLKFVRVGENTMSTKIDCEDDICAPVPQDIPWSKILKPKMYPDKLGASEIGDIALIQLKNRILYNDFVQPICLPDGYMIEHMDELLPPGELVEVAGWGMIDAVTNAVPDKLMYVSLPVVELTTCINKFAPRIDISQLCIGESDGKDSCGGDSGGPVMKIFDVVGPPRYFLVGLVSFGVKWCGTAVGVYTNVPYYMKWILDHIEK